MSEAIVLVLSLHFILLYSIEVSISFSNLWACFNTFSELVLWTALDLVLFTNTELSTWLFVIPFLTVTLLLFLVKREVGVEGGSGIEE